MTYIDAVVMAVRTADREKFRDYAERTAKVFTEHGALKVVDGWGDEVPDGQVTSFPMAVKLKDDETVVISWVIWPSREVRKAGWEKLMDDPRMNATANPMPFDGKRMIFGGFETIVEH
jgi:uncharacterized protein YbaA (DUF1428 family)